MQVQTRFPSGLHSHSSPDHQHQIRVNGTHSDSRPAYPSSPNVTSPSRTGDMHAYHYQQQQQQQAQQYEQQQYPGSAPPPPQQRQYPSNPLPPMYSTMNAMPAPPGPSGPASAAMFNPTAHLPPPMGTTLQPQPQEPPRRALSTSGSNGKYNFSLEVKQQPMRARMCGFGDKDRRPITPPPCIKLVITDMSGNPVSPEDLEGSTYILTVDLWDELAQREVNIVRSNSASPSTSISNASLTSFPPIPDRPPPGPGEYGQMMYTVAGQPIFAQPPPAYGAPHMQYGPGYYLPPMPSAMPHHFSAYHTGKAQESSNMYTRNLIGSLAVNAAVLKDPHGSEDYWFVLQDLSVRTEGFFRLKMAFVDVGNPDGEGLAVRAPVLATVYSDSFQVYSAKKFPGVIESTSLSKCFASQGIKIPIRKDLKPDRDDDED